MIKLDGMSAFVAVVEAESISEAARQLKLAKSVVSERLTELERSLGARLVQRTTRKLSLTADGQAFYQRASHIVRDVNDAAAEISERQGTLTGPLRIAGPVSFGSLHLGPALYPFLKDNPGIELTLDLDDRLVDVVAEGYDAAIRHSAVCDARVVVKPLAQSRRVLVAAPEYLALHGRPRSLTDLKQHRAIVYTNRGIADWRFHGSNGMTVVRTRNGLCVNNGLIMRDAAVAGLGIALLPTFLISAALASGELSLVDVAAEPEGAVIHIAYPKEGRVSAKVRALTEWLRGSFGDPPSWDSEIPLPNLRRYPSRASRSA
jgi:DNA-binding transcriptional LysR family regulator